MRTQWCCFAMVSSNPEVKYKDQKGIASSFFKFYPPEYSIAEKKKKKRDGKLKEINQPTAL